MRRMAGGARDRRAARRDAGGDPRGARPHRRSVHGRAHRRLHRRHRARDARAGGSGLKDLAPLIEFGASPRATIALAQASRAHAFLRGRAFVTPDDVKAIAPDVLRHRVLTTYEAEAEEVTSDEIVRRVLATVESP